MIESSLNKIKYNLNNKVTDILDDLTNDTIEVLENNDKININDFSDLYKVVLINNALLKNGGLFVVSNEIEAQKYEELFLAFNKNVRIFPKKDIRNFAFLSENHDYKLQRMMCLKSLINNEKTIIIATVEAIMQPVIAKNIIEKNFLKIKKGQEIDLKKIINFLVSLGYKKMDICDVQNIFSLRGGILDIGVEEGIGYRIELFGDEVDQIKSYYYVNQRSFKETSEIAIYPLNENILHSLNISKEEFKKLLLFNISKKGIDLDKKEDIDFDYLYNKIVVEKDEHIFEEYFNYIYEEENTIFDYLDSNSIIVFNNFRDITSRVSGILEDAINLNEEFLTKNIKSNYILSNLLSLEKILKYSNNFKQIYIESNLFDNNINDQNFFKGHIAKKTKKIGEKEIDEIFFELIESELEFLKAKKRHDIDSQIDKREYIFFNRCGEILKEIENENNLNDIYSKSGVLSNKVFGLDIFKNYIKKEKEEIKNYLQNILRLHYKEVLESKEKTGYILEKISKKILDNVWYINLNYSFNYEELSFIAKDNQNKDYYFVDITKYLKNTNFRRKKTKKQAEDLVFSDLKVGDYVVHTYNGIGKFLGIETKIVDDIAKDYIQLLYNKGDMLYISVDDLKNVKKYISTGDSEVKLSNLGTKEWEKAKLRVKNSLREIADELIELYSKRSKMKGFQFDKDSSLQREFEQEFKYIETDDQLNCIEEIKADMESDKIMDRLLCGDVGFGKTEVSMRAAFKAVLSSKQVAYIVPTTILAAQQEETFKKRMANFPINIESLSRFKTKKEIETILKKLENGEIDIIIGTHRLLSDDVNFKDLGLLIIDEEHRFGVKAKEKLKSIKENVDVLTMSATPIPRTMHMSMSHIRDISVIYEPPYQRKPIKTYIIEYDDNIIKEAIIKELERNGQIFYINNRVQELDNIAKRLKELVPMLKIGIAHGKMTSKELEKVMEDFVDNKINLLICTTILESGIDIENANTIIIEDSDKLGLAQLYQMRGRVGRSKRQAFAYISIRKNKEISEASQKRLEAIRDFTELGSGINIAIRDLEIRGAGSLLGEIQHGHLDQVGYDTYQRLLSEVIVEKSGEKIPKEQDLIIDLGVSAYIPDKYISNQKYKMDIYKSIVNCSNIDDLNNLEEEVKDIYGKYPKEVENMFLIAKNRIKLLNKGIEKIQVSTNKFLPERINIYINDEFCDEYIVACINRFKSLFKIHTGKKKYLSIDLNKYDELTILSLFTKTMENVNK